MPVYVSKGELLCRGLFIAPSPLLSLIVSRGSEPYPRSKIHTHFAMGPLFVVRRRPRTNPDSSGRSSHDASRKSTAMIETAQIYISIHCERTIKSIMRCNFDERYCRTPCTPAMHPACAPSESESPTREFLIRNPSRYSRLTCEIPYLFRACSPRRHRAVPQNSHF